MITEIRPATPDDAALLAELGASTFYETFSAFHTETDMQEYLRKAYAVSAITKNLSNPEIAYFIAFNQTETVGYTKLLLHAENPALEAPVVELEKIYVRKSCLGTGAGHALMQHALQFARDHKFRTLFLGVWQENHRAIAFYKKAGFTVFDTRTFQLGQTRCDDYLMKITF